MGRYSKKRLMEMVHSEDAHARMLAAQYGYGLPILVMDRDYGVRAQVAKQGYGLDKLVNDSAWWVRVCVAEQCYGLDRLLFDEDWMVRAEVAEQGYGLEILLNDENPSVRATVARQGYGLDLLLHDTNFVVRQCVAKQGYRLDQLHDDPDVRVRMVVRDVLNAPRYKVMQQTEPGKTMQIPVFPSLKGGFSMSHEIVKSITIQDEKVYLTSADSSLRPLTFNRWECKSLSKLLAEEGKDTLYAKIGEEIWNGNLELRQGSKLCKLYLQARNAFPKGMSFLSLESRAAGTLLGKMVTSLENDPSADLSGFVKQALDLQNDRDYILEAAKRTGHNFLNHASPELQKDKAFALEVLRAGKGAAWFDYPVAYQDDKDFALEAVKLNGCFYRYLGQALKADREIILEAFRETPDKQFHEHLPSLIPPIALFDCETDPAHPILDKAFFMDLLDACPSMHLNRLPGLLEDRDIALKWAQVGKFFPHSIGDLPKQYLTDQVFQEALINRFKGTDRYDVLLKRYAELGVSLNKQSLDSKIQSAANHASDVHSVSNTKGKMPEHEI